MRVLGKIEPQPPRGIKYMLGDETWLPPQDRSPTRLHCEEWGSLGPMILDPTIKKNKVGFDVRTTTITAPPGAIGFTDIDGVYFWTDTDQFGQTINDRRGRGSWGFVEEDELMRWADDGGIINDGASI